MWKHFSDTTLCQNHDSYGIECLGQNNNPLKICLKSWSNQQYLAISYNVKFFSPYNTDIDNIQRTTYRGIGSINVKVNVFHCLSWRQNGGVGVQLQLTSAPYGGQWYIYNMAALSTTKSPLYPLTSRLGGSLQSRSGRFGHGKSLLSVPRIERSLFCRPARSLSD